MPNRRTKVLVTSLAILALVAASCGDDDDSTAEPADQDDTTTTTTEADGDAGGEPDGEPEGEPQRGGTLTFGTYSEPAGLDPIVATGQGTTGAIEMAAIYDTLLRWNTETEEYDPRLAESVEPNDDFTEWTVQIRPGITFHDGTDYDAEAVRLGMLRHKSGQEGAPPCEELVACPANRTSSGVYMQLVSDIEVVDDLTLVFTLSDPWATFPYALSAEPSMIPSPTALREMCDPSENVNQCEFSLSPVGAGPFEVTQFSPGDSIQMVRNEDYWDGEVYLDGLEFVNLGDAGGSQTLESLRAGELQGAFLRDANATATAHEQGFSGFSTMQQSGGLFLVNLGAEVNCQDGQPEPACIDQPDGPTATDPATSDPRVRQAIAAALDPEVLDARGNDGNGFPSSEFVQDDFPWYPGPNGPTYDPDRAAELVEEAKADGWDGSLELVYNNSPRAQAIGLAAQTMLESVGMEPELDTSVDITGQIQRVIVAKDFDVSGWGMALSPDDGAIWALSQNLLSTSPSNRVGYDNPEVDALLTEMREVRDNDELTELYGQLYEHLTEDLPILSWSKIEEFKAFDDSVHGVVPSNRSMVVFDKAWME